MERNSDYIERFKEWVKPAYISELESQTSRFIGRLTPDVREELLLDKNNGNIRIYHVGKEVGVVPGFFAEDKPTGRESVFIEYFEEGDLYHVVGGVDRKSKEFSFVRLVKFEDRFVRIRRKKQIIMHVTELLRGIEEDNSDLSSQY